jgi:hypothetical protein
MPKIQEYIHDLLRTFEFDRPLMSLTTQHWMIIIYSFLQALTLRDEELNATLKKDELLKRLEKLKIKEDQFKCFVDTIINNV